MIKEMKIMSNIVITKNMSTEERLVALKEVHLRILKKAVYSYQTCRRCSSVFVNGLMRLRLLRKRNSTIVYPKWTKTTTIIKMVQRILPNIMVPVLRIRNHMSPKKVGINEWNAFGSWHVVTK